MIARLEAAQKLLPLNSTFPPRDLVSRVRILLFLRQIDYEMFLKKQKSTIQNYPFVILSYSKHDYVSKYQHNL